MNAANRSWPATPETWSATHSASQDGDELVAELASALAADYRLVDSIGNTVACGRVDGPALTLDPGTYELVIQTDRGPRSEHIVIEPQGNLEFEVNLDQ